MEKDREVGLFVAPTYIALSLSKHRGPYFYLLLLIPNLIAKI